MGKSCMGNLNMSATSSPVVFSVGFDITLISLLDPNNPAARRYIAEHGAVEKIKMSIDFASFTNRTFLMLRQLANTNITRFDKDWAHFGGPSLWHLRKI